ncbi:MAG: hypothetical protein CL869_00685 [Cytophagia bacterium]|nr:hypothetical protein [Cytophagia bacterium]|tara:strand:- start:186 stop:1034 length:849 start_codon:yes stop_codon:yes gene_type:complete
MVVGIIGMGYVGSALKEGFKKYHSIETFDIQPSLSTCKNQKELASKSKIIFVCLPTPMKMNGVCDTSIVQGAISELNDIIDHKSDKIIVIKSTIPPGTTENFNREYSNLNIVFNPEFLTEANFIEDFRNQNRIILGGPRPATTAVKQFYIKIFPKATIVKTGSTYAEMVKYFANTFLATKVSFANEMKIICEKLEIDYDKVVEYAIYDNRLGKSHWAVPGPDGKPGFGGSCFPKDINALINKAKELGVETDVLNSVWKTNLKVRPERDWEQLKGRAISKDDE